MTAASLTLGPSYAIRRTSSSGGFSAPARFSTESLQTFVTRAWNTATGQQPGVAAIPALGEIYRDAEIESVHGEQTAPAPAAMLEATALLESLPSWCAVPAPLIEPSGAIAFEWDLGPDRWLVLALKGTGTIEFSALIGRGDEVYGTTNFSGQLGKRELGLLRDLMQIKV